jgi:quercetin dioxygenase-like cupin family protein
MNEIMHFDAGLSSSALFIHGHDSARVEVDPGVTRQVLGFNETLMVCRVWFETGARGVPHVHPHAQVTYVEKGRFLFRVGSETREVSAGDCVQIPQGELHGAECLDAGILLDCFSPARADFLEESKS